MALLGILKARHKDGSTRIQMTPFRTKEMVVAEELDTDEKLVWLKWFGDEPGRENRNHSAQVLAALCLLPDFVEGLEEILSEVDKAAIDSEEAREAAKRLAAFAPEMPLHREFLQNM